MKRSVAAVFTAAVVCCLGFGCSSKNNEPAVLRTDKVEAPKVEPLEPKMPIPNMGK